MYKCLYSEELTRKLAKLKKKDLNQFSKIIKKIDFILQNPKHSYKFLHKDMKGLNRIHIGPFVLVFMVNHKQKIISFEDYDHHDKIYLKKKIS